MGSKVEQAAPLVANGRSDPIVSIGWPSVWANSDIRRKLVGQPDNERSIPEAEIANQATGGSKGSALRVRLLGLRGDRSGRRCWGTMGIAEAEIRGQ